jgi:hypothetical protein
MELRSDGADEVPPLRARCRRDRAGSRSHPRLPAPREGADGKAARVTRTRSRRRLGGRGLRPVRRPARLFYLRLLRGALPDRRRPVGVLARARGVADGARRPGIRATLRGRSAAAWRPPGTAAKNGRYDPPRPLRRLRARAALHGGGVSPGVRPVPSGWSVIEEARGDEWVSFIWRATRSDVTHRSEAGEPLDGAPLYARK